jgi:RNA polymerase sigma-70 factor (ECF subfamily)
MNMPDEGAPPTSELLERWVAGDAAAGQEIYLRYYERALAFSRRLMARDIDAEEVAQEALAAGLEGIKGGKRPDQFTGWILGVVRHAARNRPKQMIGIDIERKQTPAARVPSVRSRLIRAEMNGLLDGALAKLDEREQEILRCRFVEGLSQEEAAARVGLGVSTFHRTMERVLSKLRTDLSRHFTTIALAQQGAPGERKRIRWSDVEGLRPSFRKVLVARHVKNLAPPEAAASLAIPIETFWARLRSAYDQLACGPDDDYALVRLAYTARYPEEGG